MLRSFIRYNKEWSIQALVFLAVACWSFFDTFIKLYSNYDIYYVLARSCGALLKFPLIPSIIPPICRVLFTNLRLSPIGRYLGLDRRLADHKLFATGASVFAIIHVVAHLFHNRESLYTRAGITGILMMSSLALPLAGVFLIRKYMPYNYGAQVLRPHQVGSLLFTVAYAWHANHLIAWAIVFYSAYIIDRILEKTLYTHDTRIKKAQHIASTNYIMLTIERPRNFHKSYPGQYALLSFPEIDAFLECKHPFTIVRDDADGLCFIIQRSGPWTTRLAELIDENQTGCKLRIIVTGPYGATLDRFSDRSVSFIGTGIGITPFLSYLNYRKTGPVSVYFSQRTMAELQPVFETLDRIDKMGLSINLYVTGEEPTRKDVNRGRLNILDIVKNSTTVAVCGNPQVTKDVKNFSLKYGKPCFEETF